MSTADDLLAAVARLTEHDLPVRGGRVTAYVYDTGRPEVHEAATRAYAAMLEVNTLDPTAFPSVVAMEKEVVGQVAAVLGGGHGIFTSGGTESIMLAVKAARDAAETRRPNLVAPVTAHPAFHKAAHYLGLEVRAVPVDLETFRVTAAAVRERIDADTVLVVCSAPSYPQGVVDPVAEVAAVAAAAGVPCHVDACVGGWLLPWLREAGAEVPAFDLSVPGVTSISCDLHKFGYAPKGASVVLFADPAMRRRAYFASAAWPGYTVINATVQSSRSAGPLGGAWATLRAIGREGYVRLARDTLEAARMLREGLAKIPGLRVLGDPAGSLIAFTSAEIDVFVLADEARARGWFIQPQLSYAGIPANLHITVTGATLATVDAMLAVIKESAAAARERGPVAVPDGLIAMVTGLDLDALGDREFGELAAAAGVDLTSAGQPGMALVNAILDALPAAKREEILIRFLSVMYT
ncbi:pyridoxal phosphate-dependent decarboxylase family protein [Nonomuraea typhae]|uniref:pyridoxal phosphate-dependent decarboxylase family protein n=1 Tax=Nonomuraea typhae TaxID=2603600 RepID=UPI0012FCDFC0|nr:aspartate aminotransferase family protein [Nonomuraea typhae]